MRPQQCPEWFVFLHVLMATLTTMLILTAKRVRLWRGGEGVREASDDDAGPVRVEPHFKHAVFSQNSRLLCRLITRKVKAKRTGVALLVTPGVVYFLFGQLDT